MIRETWHYLPKMNVWGFVFFLAKSSWSTVLYNLSSKTLWGLWARPLLSENLSDPNNLPCKACYLIWCIQTCLSEVQMSCWMCLNLSSYCIVLQHLVCSVAKISSKKYFDGTFWFLSIHSVTVLVKLTLHNHCWLECDRRIDFLRSWLHMLSLRLLASVLNSCPCFLAIHHFYAVSSFGFTGGWNNK